MVGEPTAPVQGWWTGVVNTGCTYFLSGIVTATEETNPGREPRIITLRPIDFGSSQVGLDRRDKPLLYTKEFPMYLNHVGRDITISLDSPEEAAALLAVLSGTPIDDRSRQFGQGIYSFFYQAVHKLATNFGGEVKNIHPFPHDPKKGRKGTL